MTHCCDEMTEAVANMPRGDDLRFYPPERGGPRYIAVADGFELDFCPFCGTDIKVPGEWASNRCSGNNSCGCNKHHQGRHCCHMMEGSVKRKNVNYLGRRKTLPKYVLPRKTMPIKFCPWCKDDLTG